MNTNLTYRRDMIARFWEERKQTNPHMAYLWDITEELVRKAQISEPERKAHQGALESVKEELRRRLDLTIHELEVLSQRHALTGLSEEVDYKDRNYAVGDILTMEHEIAGKLTQIVSDIAVLYSMEYTMSKQQTNTNEWG